jgi:hypothetical protein
MTPSEQRRFDALQAAFVHSDRYPVPVCDCLAAQFAEGESPRRGMWTVCGDHPLVGILCASCHDGHDARFGIEHDVYTANRFGCLNGDAAIGLVPDEVALAEVRFTDVTVISQVGERRYHLDAIIVLANIADRLCDECRAKT